MCSMENVLRYVNKGQRESHTETKQKEERKKKQEEKTTSINAPFYHLLDFCYHVNNVMDFKSSCHIIALMTKSGDLKSPFSEES